MTDAQKPWTTRPRTAFGQAAPSSPLFIVLTKGDPAMAKTNKNCSYHRAADKPRSVRTNLKKCILPDARPEMMSDDAMGVVAKDEARIRYRAKRVDYCVVRTRGLENRRREQCGIGTFMLLSHDGVALFAATLSDIAEFLDRAPLRQLH